MFTRSERYASSALRHANLHKSRYLRAFPLRLPNIEHQDESQEESQGESTLHSQFRGDYVLVKIPGHNDTTLMIIEDERYPYITGENVSPAYLSGEPAFLQYFQKIDMQVVYRPHERSLDTLTLDPLTLDIIFKVDDSGNTWHKHETLQSRKQIETIKEEVNRSFQRWLGELLLATSENFVYSSMKVLTGCWEDLRKDLFREIRHSNPSNLSLILYATIVQKLRNVRSVKNLMSTISADSQPTSPTIHPYLYHLSFHKSFQKFQKVFIAHHHTAISHSHLTLPMKKFIEGKMAPLSFSIVKFRVQWDAIEFLERNFEPGQASVLGPVKVVIGCPEYAELVTCQEYIERQWGRTGLLRLEFIGEEIQKYLDLCPQDRSQYEAAGDGTTHGAIRLHFRRKDEAYFEFEGWAADASEFGEQLLWLTSVLRRSNNDGLAQSTAYFTCCLYGDQHIRIGLDKLCKPSNHSIDGYNKDCWISMWYSGVIAPGFPIRNRILGPHDAIPRGLEVDATTMFQLAGTSTPVEFLGGIVVMGENSMLYPIWKSCECIQWHLFQSSNSEECVKTLKHRKWYKTTDLTEYLSQRAVLGCWETAWVLLGTPVPEKYEAARSNLPNRRGNFGLVPEISFSSTMSAKPAGVGLSFTAGGKFSRTFEMTVGIENAKLGFTASLQRMKSRPLLVYDVGEKQGWLVSELSMLLHLVQVYVSKTYGKPHAHFAKPQADGGKAAYDTIKKHANDQVSCDPMDENDASKFSDHVKSFMQVFEAVSKSFEMERIASKMTSSFGRSRRPTGFDYMDILERRYLHCKKELSGKRSTPRWWEIAQNPGTIVIFGKGFGQLIGPNLDGSNICSHWTKIPSGDNLLTASMPCLQEIIKSNETDKEDEAEVFLAEHLYWYRPHSTNLARVCNNKTREPCMLVQKVKKVGMLQSGKGYPVKVSDLKNMNNGAVVFGDLSTKNIPTDSCRPIHPRDTANQLAQGEDKMVLPDRTKRPTTMRLVPAS